MEFLPAYYPYKKLQLLHRPRNVNPGNNSILVAAITNSASHYNRGEQLTMRKTTCSIPLMQNELIIKFNEKYCAV